MPNFVSFASKRKIGLIRSINESHFWIKKLHLNRKGNSTSAKNLINYLETYWWEVSESNMFLKECISSSSGTKLAKNAPCTLYMIKQNNLNRVIFANININSIRNNFDMLASQIDGNADVIMISRSKIDAETATVGVLWRKVFLEILWNS